MSARRKKGCLARLFASLIALLCALVLGAAFYATMVYQLAGEDGALVAQVEGDDAGLQRIVLHGPSFLRETEGTARFGGETCTVLTREYALVNGATVLAVSATPAAYIERLAKEGWTPQLITGFVLAGIDAVYEKAGERAMLVAREGNTVYLIEGELGEDALYTLGAGAQLEPYDAP